MHYVKKLMIIFLIGIFCIGLMGASIWEGAAAMAAGGELPEKGYYIATNSFPRNTMVDVVNLENGKTLRAIVVGGVDTPGLLGILSREAATALGLEKGVVGRIRVNMPADPIAFSRYTEDLAKAGDPDRDPAAALSLTQTESAPAAAPAAVAAAEEKPAEPVQNSASEQRTAQTVPSVEEVPVAPSIVVSAGTGETSKPEDEKIQELPELSPQSSAAAVAEEPSKPAEIAPETAAVTEAPAALAEEVPSAVLSEAQPEPASPELAKPAEDATPEAAAMTEVPAEPAVTITAEPAAAEPLAQEPTKSAAETSPAMEAPAPGSVVLSLEPAEERPPVGASAETVAPADLPAVKKAEPIRDIPEAPSPIIKDVAETTVTIPAPVPETIAVNEPVPTGAPEPEVSMAVEKPDAPEMAIKPESSLVAPPAQIAPIAIPAEPVAPAAPAVNPSVAVSPTTPHKLTFSVPVVTSLSKGKYYIQLGAFTKAETVENQIMIINKKYPLLVQVAGTAERPLYRLLIGPLNEGESGALVSYFKKSGFKDAFVKKES